MKNLALLFLLITFNFYGQNVSKGYTCGFGIGASVSSSPSQTSVQPYTFQYYGHTEATFNGQIFPLDSTWIINIFDGDIVTVSYFQDDYGSPVSYCDPFLFYYGITDTTLISYPSSAGGNNLLIKKEFSDSAYMKVGVMHTQDSVAIKIIINPTPIITDTLDIRGDFVSQDINSHNAFIHFESENPVNVKLFSFRGELIKDWIVSEDFTVDMSEFEGSVYFFTAIIDGVKLSGRYVKN